MKREVFHIILFCLVSFIAHVLLFYNHLIPTAELIVGFTEVVVFFTAFLLLSTAWKNFPDHKLQVFLFVTALAGRLAAAVFFYYYFYGITGRPFEINAVDSIFYHETSGAAAGFFRQAIFVDETIMPGVGFSDQGYNYYVGLIYAFGGRSILLVRICNAVLGGFSVLLLYRMAKLLFTQREIPLYTGLLALLLPNFYLYLGGHTKETVLVFTVTAAIYLLVRIVQSGRVLPFHLLLLVCCTFYLFMLRTVIAACFCAAMALALVQMITVSRRKWLMPAFVVLLVIGGVFFLVSGSPVYEEVTGYLERAGTQQSESLQYRAERENGNKLALLAGAPLFIFIIFMVPFPSFVYVEAQDMLWMFTGANFIRNALAFFMITGLWWIWKRAGQAVRPVVYFTLFYLLALCASPFAISERFHLPVVPFLLLFAAAGLVHTTTRSRKFFPLYLVAMVVLQIGWNYVKLLGRM